MSSQGGKSRSLCNGSFGLPSSALRLLHDAVGVRQRQQQRVRHGSAPDPHPAGQRQQRQWTGPATGALKVTGPPPCLGHGECGALGAPAGDGGSRRTDSDDAAERSSPPVPQPENAPPARYGHAIRGNIGKNYVGKFLFEILGQYFFDFFALSY